MSLHLSNEKTASQICSIWHLQNFKLPNNSVMWYLNIFYFEKNLIIKKCELTLMFWVWRMTPKPATHHFYSRNVLPRVCGWYTYYSGQIRVCVSKKTFQIGTIHTWPKWRWQLCKWIWLLLYVVRVLTDLVFFYPFVCRQIGHLEKIWICKHKGGRQY